MMYNLNSSLHVVCFGSGETDPLKTKIKVRLSQDPCFPEEHCLVG